MIQFTDLPKSPEFMPWKSSIDKNIDGDVLLQVSLTDTVENKNNGNYPVVKYSLETPCCELKVHITINT